MMPKRRVIVIQNDESWNDFLQEAFEDTLSLPEIVRSSKEALPLLREGRPDVVFVNPLLLTPVLSATLRALRTSDTNCRTFQLGLETEASSLPLAGIFDGKFGKTSEGLDEFQKTLSFHLPVPEVIKVLVADDEPGVGEAFREYFEGRTKPVVKVEVAKNGIEAEEKVEKITPDVIVLDIKMPERDGREVYRNLKKKEKLPPTIVFFDIVAAEEVLEIRRLGNAAFVEKGSRSSQMPEMSALIRKMAYFG